ncbi:polymorphic toxin type 37 domain-containing protein [Waddlia chondrophila]|uniref:polymorphic toxin type 37 domain-containing protein n=1 Tax=Waddlia chondrophila TaxID=71667 RepID=UPI00187D3681|nr:polymorphic toxin type 37 domain-containing protein [Waddlia chondrophila]
MAEYETLNFHQCQTNFDLSITCLGLPDKGYKLKPENSDLLMRGKGSYINPKNKRQYHIDPKYSGRYREPNHVDVSRPKGYEGNLPKKRFSYLDD